MKKFKTVRTVEGFRNRTVPTTPASPPLGYGPGENGLMQVTRMDKTARLYWFNGIFTREEWDDYLDFLWDSIEAFGVAPSKYIDSSTNEVNWAALSQDLGVSNSKILTNVICTSDYYRNWGIT
jgi:hypothetical protein